MKNCLTVSCFILCLLVGCKSNNPIIWEQILHKKRANGVEKMMQLSTGDFIVGAYTQGKFQPWTDNYDTDIWLIKLDNKGKVIWDKVIGNNDRNLTRSIVETRDKGYLVSAWHKEKDSILDEKYNVYDKKDDFYILKLNPDGHKLWEKKLRAEGYDFIKDAQETDDDGYIVSGSSNSKRGGDKKNSSLGAADFWIVKLDSKREIQWQKSIGAGRNEKLENLIQTLDGGYLIAGYSDSLEAKDEFPNKKKMNDYFILKLNNKGKLVWYKMYGGSEDDMLDVAIQTKDKGFVLGGMSNSKIGEHKTSPNIGDYDIWLIKTDTIGKIIWQNTYGGTGIDNIETIQELGNEDLLIGGTKAIESKINDSICFQKDFYLLKTNSVGIKKWEINLGGSENDFLYSAYQIDNGNIIVSGRSQSFLDLNRKSIKGANDIWLFEYNTSEYEDFQHNMKLQVLKDSKSLIFVNKENIFGYEFFDKTGCPTFKKRLKKSKKIEIEINDVFTKASYIKLIGSKSNAIYDVKHIF